MSRRIALAVVGLAVAATALPAQAGTKTQTLYFGNAGGCGADAPAYILAPTPTGSQCSGHYATVNGSGITEVQSFVQQKAISGKLDTKRPLTGVLYIKSGFLNGVPTDPSMPATIDATLVVKVGSTTVGTVPVKGTAAVTALKTPFSLTLPSSLSKSNPGKVSATLTHNTTVGGGVETVSFTAPQDSHIIVPMK